MVRLFRIIYRERNLVNTDPQRRCYNGHHYSSELRWSPWKVLESDVGKHCQPLERLKFWKELNDYAVECRGESSRIEYRLELMP